VTIVCTSTWLSDLLWAVMPHVVGMVFSFVPIIYFLRVRKQDRV
jgi:hypothetical protein